MGLDTYAYEGTRNEPLDDALFSHIPPLHGGVFSGSAGSVSSSNCCYGSTSSMRGKVYASFLQDHAGLNLYQEWIAAPEIETAAARLQDWLASASKEDIKYACRKHGLTLLQMRSLAEWIAVVAENKGRLHGWW
jgi:hypothetical protein